MIGRLGIYMGPPMEFTSVGHYGYSRKKNMKMGRENRKSYEDCGATYVAWPPMNTTILLTGW